MTTFRCPHCKKLWSLGTMKSRGLCQTCHRDRNIRFLYPFKNRGCWYASSRVWTLDDKSDLFEMVRAGLSDKQIAMQLERSIGSITKARQRLELSKETYHPRRLTKHGMRIAGE